MFQNRTMMLWGKLASFLAVDVLVSVWANLSFFSHYGNEKIRFTLLIFYTSSVWALYLADHLWDALREKETLSERGSFYLRFRHWIVSFLIFLTLVSFFVGFYFEFLFLTGNLLLLLSFVFSIGLIVSHLSPIPKEILVSGFYVLGVIAPFGSFGGWDPMVWIFFIHVFANVLLTYNTDREFDLVQNTFTLTQVLDPKKLKVLVLCLLGMGFCFLMAQRIWGNLSELYFLGMGSAYLWLGVCHFVKMEGFRFKSLCELSYLPLFLPQIVFFFSLLP
ncbi:hypothetical protein [Leptospira kanakyensis]|nr:hypothetical protein [Leptospira kanakyensis]MCW7471613.1 hypothetical protein [Leptospira kanakyensis]MCW7481265.1 hypothetical protein [Leptospira kanakyensis]